MPGAELRVSVAMCTYNGEAFVQQQLESILHQSRPPDELVVCDDVSTDRTMEIVRDVLAGCRFPVRIIENKRNLRCIRNFEKAVGETSGDVIFLCDYDDFWFPKKISAMLEPFAASPEVVLVYCDAELADASLKPSGETVFQRRGAMRLATAPTAHQIGRGIGFNGPMMAFHALLKPSVLPFSNQWAHDHWISFLAYAVGEVQCVDEPLLYYRRYGKNEGGDADLDGGLLHRLRVVAQVSELRNYAQRSRRFSDMLDRLRQIRQSATPLKAHNRLHELLLECEACLRFAQLRERLRRRWRLRRMPASVGSLIRGDYHRYAHGGKSFIQDVTVR